jgi:hypothetical protein
MKTFGRFFVAGFAGMLESIIGRTERQYETSRSQKFSIVYSCLAKKNSPDFILLSRSRWSIVESTCSKSTFIQRRQFMQMFQSL